MWILLFPSTIHPTLWNRSYLRQPCLMPQKFCIFSTNWVFLEVEFNLKLPVFPFLYKRITKSCRNVFYTCWTRLVFNATSVELEIRTTGFSIAHLYLKEEGAQMVPNAGVCFFSVRVACVFIWSFLLMLMFQELLFPLLHKSVFVLIRSNFPQVASFWPSSSLSRFPPSCSPANTVSPWRKEKC